MTQACLLVAETQLHYLCRLNSFMNFTLLYLRTKMKTTTSQGLMKVPLADERVLRSDHAIIVIIYMSNDVLVILIVVFGPRTGFWSFQFGTHFGEGPGIGPSTEVGHFERHEPGHSIRVFGWSYLNGFKGKIRPWPEALCFSCFDL